MDTNKLHSLFIQQKQKISTDTRNIIPDSIFFALKGENFNGNSFAEEAILKGAKYSVIDEPSYKTSENIILVEDVLKCLQELALYHRKKLTIPIIGITGSNGKTTTKELTLKVLSQKYRTLATKGNLNNHIGVPLSLLSIMPYHEMAIIEMGANHRHEIDFLCNMAQPNFGIITNIGKAHLEGFGGMEGVIKTKTELYNFIKETKGKIFININDDLLLKYANGIEQISYGTLSKAHCNAKILETFPFLKLEWKNISQTHIIDTKLYGKYNFSNIMAAICIGNYFNVPDRDIIKALEEFAPDNNRSQIIEKNGNTIISDAYNANPSSMKEALLNFSELKAENKLCILGDMLELGNDSTSEHKKIIELLKKLEFKNVILVGNNFYSINLKPFLSFKDYKETANYLKQNKPTQFTILIKGSRGIKLENVIECL